MVINSGRTSKRSPIIHQLQIWLIIWKMYVVATLGVVYISRLKRVQNARCAAFSFFPKRSGGCAPEAFVVEQPSAVLSVTRRKFRHMTCGALAAFWKVKMFLSRRGRAWKKTSASLPLCARIPRVYIWNNELERAKDAIFKRPLTWPLNMMLT